jgi:hypothetical protein
VGKPDEKADLYARVDIQMPTHLSPQEREHYEALRKLNDGAKNDSAA